MIHVFGKNLFSIWKHIWLEMEGLGVGLAETWELLCPGKVFFRPKNGTFIFLPNGIMIFRCFYRNSIGFGRFGGPGGANKLGVRTCRFKIALCRDKKTRC